MTPSLPRSALLLVSPLLALVGCSTSEDAPSSVGRYALTAYLGDSTDLPLPYRQETATPGDSESWDAADLTLRGDSTWVALWHHTLCPGGACQPAHTDTLHGVFSTLPPPTGAELALHLDTWPYVGQGGAALIRGRRLELYGFWVFRRR
jgi:hypothetical protein